MLLAARIRLLCMSVTLDAAETIPVGEVMLLYCLDLDAMWLPLAVMRGGWNSAVDHCHGPVQDWVEISQLHICLLAEACCFCCVTTSAELVVSFEAAISTLGGWAVMACAAARPVLRALPLIGAPCQPTAGLLLMGRLLL